MILVVTPGSFQIELAGERNIEIIAEHRNIELDKACPNRIGLRIRQIRQRWRTEPGIGVLAGIIGSKHIHIIRLVSAADGRLDLSAGNVQQWAVEAGAFLLDLVNVAQNPCGSDVVECYGRIAAKHSRIAE